MLILIVFFLIIVLGYVISNHLSRKIKLYDATVDINGAGNFKSVADAFNSGAKSVYVKKGTYTETQNINIPNEGVLVGEDPSSTIINFNGKPYSIQSKGNKNGIFETNGTVSITNNSNLVIGVGTTFTNLSPGDIIFLVSDVYIIETIADDTNLTISAPYRGMTETGVLYSAYPYYSGLKIEGLTIVGSSTIGVYICGNVGFLLQRLFIQNCALNMRIQQSSIGTIRQIFTRNSLTEGMNIDNCNLTTISNCSITNNSTHGLTLVNTTNRLVITDTNFSNNNNNGIRITGMTIRNIILSCIVSNNNSTGIINNANSVDNSFEDCIIENNNGNGIEVGISNNIIGTIITGNLNSGIIGDGNGNITGCNISNNGSYGIDVINKNNSLISSNEVLNNTNTAIRVRGDFNTINSNRCDNNGNGIEIRAGGSDRNTVVGNNLYGNTGSNFINNGTNTLAASNLVA